LVALNFGLKFFKRTTEYLNTNLMKLIKTEIKNFRSISDLTVEFASGCVVLLGINESGKSNILKALSLLDPLVKVNRNDLRIERHEEEPVDMGWVRFVFEFSDEELDEIFAPLEDLIEQSSMEQKLFEVASTQVTLRDWLKSRNQVLHIVDLPDGARRNTPWAIRPDTKIVKGWFRNKLSTVLELDFSPGRVDPLMVLGNGFVFLNEEEAKEIPSLEPAKLSHFSELTREAPGAYLKKNLPKSIFWRYSESLLLPSLVNMANFCANPDSCIPLKSMFELAGYDLQTLASKIATAKATGQHRYLQILEKTGTSATKHIRAIWAEHNTITLKLEADGENVIPIVLEKDIRLDMANRSDGFKRFVSFLLQVSAKVKTAELADTLILVDEPEIGLHPSGAKNLMKELIAIGASNPTVYSTHSIFMIDKDKIDRHYIVERKNEATTVYRASKSIIQDEEVLFAAVGYSIFESLRKHNVIFEGWCDKNLFDVLRKQKIRSNPTTKSLFSSIGFTHAAGVKDVKNVAKFLELASRHCLIISDSDTAARQHQKLYKADGGWGEWKLLSEIMSDSQIATAEDLLKSKSIICKANKLASKKKWIKLLDDSAFTQKKPNLAVLTNWLETNNLNGELLKTGIYDLKLELFADLKRSDLIDSAELLIDFVLNYQFEKDI
jgi:energy-coupling factor transporter ATP-binding protein EcfA2